MTFRPIGEKEEKLTKSTNTSQIAPLLVVVVNTSYDDEGSDDSEQYRTWRDRCE